MGCERLVNDIFLIRPAKLKLSILQLRSGQKKTKNRIKIFCFWLIPSLLGFCFPPLSYFFSLSLSLAFSKFMQKIFGLHLFLITFHFLSFIHSPSTPPHTHTCAHISTITNTPTTHITRTQYNTLTNTHLYLNINTWHSHLHAKSHLHSLYTPTHIHAHMKPQVTPILIFFSFLFSSQSPPHVPFRERGDWKKVSSTKLSIKKFSMKNVGCPWPSSKASVKSHSNWKTNEWKESQQFRSFGCDHSSFLLDEKRK